MNVKTGDYIIAKKTIYMEDDDEDLCLLENKKYKIRSMHNNQIVFKSETCNDHYWGIDELDYYFHLQYKLSNNIKIL